MRTRAAAARPLQPCLAAAQTGPSCRSRRRGRGVKFNADDLLAAEGGAGAAKELTPEQAAEQDFAFFDSLMLCTREEWTLIQQQQRDGVQSWRTVYQWAAALVAEASAAGRMQDRLAPVASVHAMLMEIRNCGGRVFTMMTSQLPYTYVHLVSFVCHVFLWILASYFGFVLYAGIPQTTYDVILSESVTGMAITGTVGSKRNLGTTPSPDGWWLIRTQIYLMIAFTNVLVQGLLSMHSLLENPFGQHPCKFPLTAYAVDHIRQTNAMLVDASEREPEQMAQLFKSAGGGGGGGGGAAAAGGAAGGGTRRGSANGTAGGASAGKG